MRHALAFLAVFCVFSPVVAQETPDQQRCRELRALYDRYANRGEGNSFNGRLERDIGVDLCRRGQYAAGIAELQKALKILNIQ
jgi:hypothetical protein